MFTSKLFRVAYAISVAEGWFPRLTHQGYPDGTASFINHNPGNLRSSPFECGQAPNGYAIFENDLVGFYALVWQLWVYASDRSRFVPPNDTIYDAIHIYNNLPLGSTELDNYVSILEKVGGVNRADKIESLLQ